MLTRGRSALGGANQTFFSKAATGLGTGILRSRISANATHHSLVNGAATNTLHWWSGELTANYSAMQVALGFNTEREAGVAFFIVF